MRERPPADVQPGSVSGRDNGIKAWVICPGFVDTDMDEVVPGANSLNFLRVGDVVDVAGT
jgi:hypothetical protein